MRRIAFCVAQLAACRPANCRAQEEILPGPPPAVLAECRTVVFVANGSFGKNPVCDAVAEAATAAGVPLFIESVPWTRSKFSTLNHKDRNGHETAAGWLAARVCQVNSE